MDIIRLHQKKEQFQDKKVFIFTNTQLYSELYLLMASQDVSCLPRTISTPVITRVSTSGGAFIDLISAMAEDEMLLTALLASSRAGLTLSSLRSTAALRSTAIDSLDAS